MKGTVVSQWEAAIKAEEAVSATASHFPQITPAIQFGVVELAGEEDRCFFFFFCETEGKLNVTQHSAVMISRS